MMDELGYAVAVLTSVLCAVLLIRAYLAEQYTTAVLDKNWAAASLRGDGLAQRPAFWLDPLRLSQSTAKALAASSDIRPLGDALAFMQLLWAVAHGLESSSKRMHAALGITGPQRLVLRIVGHHGRIGAGQIADILHIHPSSLTGMLKRLEQADLLRRESDPFDRRRALLALTRRGQRLNDQRHGTIEAVVAATLGKVSKERIVAAKSVLKAIATALAEDSPSKRR